MQFFFVSVLIFVKLPNRTDQSIYMFLTMFSALLGFAILYGLLWLAVPKGRLLYELIHLPPFWLQLLRAPSRGFREERIRYGTHPRQYFLLCLPPAPVALGPSVILYFHGGGWQFGAPEQFRAHARQLTQKGYVVILPSCRRVPRYNYRHLREDLTRLLAQVWEVLAQRGMGDKQAIIGGMSAGGNMAALAALNHEELKRAGIPAGWLRGLFLFGAPLHLEKMADTFSVRNFAGPRAEPMFRQASPYYYLDKPLAIPTLIIHGAKDGMVEYEGVQEFARRMQQVNAEETRFLSLPEGTHLDVASWFFREGVVRETFREWLAGLDG